MSVLTRKALLRGLGTLLLLLVMLYAPLPSAQAQTIALTDCTRDGLNTAIQTAPDGSTITFDCPTNTITFTQEIVIDKTITVDGGGTMVLDALAGDGIYSRFFTVNPIGNFTVIGLTLQEGSTPTEVEGFSDTGGAIYNLGSLSITNSVFIDNYASDGGAIYNSGITTITSSVFNMNGVDQGGGAIYNENSLTVENSRFYRNSAFEGGAISSSGVLNVSNNKILDNDANGAGGAIYNWASGTGNITNNCFVGNFDDAINDFSDTITDLNHNWWGTASGPSGVGPGDGDTIVGVTDSSKYNSFLRFPSFEIFKCPTIVPDLYDATFGETLRVTAEEGVISNDLEVRRTTVELDTEPDFGDLALRSDGSFEYVALPGDEVDGFRYSVLETDGARVVGLVCITRSNLSLTVPPTQTTTLGNPIPVPDVRVLEGNDPNSTQVVRVQLQVQTGTLNVAAPNQGTIGIPPSQECKDLLDELRTASIIDAPSVMQQDTGGIELMSRNSRPQFVPYQQQGGNVSVTGNGTNTLTVEGPIADVNAVLISLTYTPAVVGVDQLVIVANNAGGDVAVGQVTIIVNGGSPTMVSSGGGVDTDEIGPPPPEVIPIPLGPLTLFEISQFPNTVIRGEATNENVENGDVFVRVIATNGTLQVGTEQIGDPFLLEQGVFNGADVFGLTFGGVPVQGFNGSVTVCLRGFGTFYYRDATSMPRTTVALQTFVDGAFTCAVIPNSGTVVLVSSGEAPPEAQTVPAASAGAGRVTLPDGCMVTTDAIINLREGPGTTNAIIRRIPFDVTLTAFEQEGGWYYVDYWGQRGWMSADYVTPNRNC